MTKLSILERRMNVKDYTLLVRDFRNEKNSPVICEIQVFDRKGNELKELHSAVFAEDRVATIKQLRTEARAHLKMIKQTAKSKKQKTNQKL